MSNHSFTLFYAFKASICFFGYVWSLLLGQPSDLLMWVSVASLVAMPLFYFLEGQQ
jgi:hypothetical protein